MADIDRLSRALQRAHEAGDTNAARRLANEIRRQRAGGEQQQAQGQEVSTTMDVLGQFGSGFNRGLYSFANAPTALANMIPALAGSDFRFKRPLEAIVPGADQAIMERPEAQTAAGQLAGTIGEYGGANVIPGGAAIGMAPRIAAATAGSQNLAGQVVNRAATGIAAAPGTAAAGEVLATVGAGTGAQIARDVAPGSPGAEMLGATLGGFAAPMALAVSPANMARKATRAVRKRLSPEAVARQQRQQIAGELNKTLTPEARQSIQQTQEIQDIVPDYRPSLAEAVENPDLLATQQVFERNLSGPALNQAAARYGQNEQAIRRAAGELAPSSSMTPDDVFAQARSRPRGVLRGIDAREESLRRQQTMVAEGLESGTRRREQGANLRQHLIDDRARMKEEMSITAREMGLDDTSAVYDLEPMKNRLRMAVEPRSPLADRSAIPQNILDDVGRMDKPASIVDLMELRTRITTDIREAQRTPTGEKRVPYLERLKAEVDNITDDLIRRSDDPDLADRLQDFRRIYREDFVLPFEQGAAGNVLRKDITGAYKIPDEQVAKEFFDGWNQTAADQFNRAFQNNRAAHAAMEAAAFDDLHSFAVRDGILDPTRIDAWARRNQGVLGNFPNIRDRLQNVQATVDGIARRQAVMAERRKQVEQSYLARELARIDSPVTQTTPERVIEAAIDRNPARMRRLLNSVKSDEARNAVARHVWDKALESNDPVGFLRTNAASMQAALGDNYQNAVKLARAIQKNQLVPRPSGQPIDTNPLGAVEDMMGTGLNQVMSRIFAAESGRTSARWVSFDIAGRYFRAMSARQARETLQEALYDPQIATDLARVIANERPTPQSMKRIYTFLVSNGIVAATGEDERRAGGNNPEPLQIDVFPNR